jgi:uroporphyrinogen decarboxylase
MKINRNPSFERFLTAINRKEPDRLPAAENWVDPEVKRAFLGKPVLNLKDEVEFWVAAGYDFVALDTDLYAAPEIQNRIVQSHTNTAETYQTRREERNWVSSHATVIRTWEDVARFPWPRADAVDLSAYEEIPTLLPDGMKVVVTLGHLFTAAWQMMGFEDFCVALLDDPALVKNIIDRLGDETLLLMERVLSYDCVGAIWMQDDIAYTNGPMVSPKLLRQIFFPWMKRAADLCHACNRPFLFHSDGMLDLVVPDIIEAGVDALHPIEPKCMDIVKVKQQYGDRLALIGNLDLGYTLTRGTPEEVREAVLYLVKNVAPGGGFMLGSANSVTNYVPLKNYRAMLDATFEYGAYPINIS